MASAALITFGGPGIETDKNKDNVLELTGKADYPVPSKMAGQAFYQMIINLTYFCLFGTSRISNTHLVGFPFLDGFESADPVLHFLPALGAEH